MLLFNMYIQPNIKGCYGNRGRVCTHTLKNDTPFGGVWYRIVCTIINIVLFCDSTSRSTTQPEG